MFLSSFWTGGDGERDWPMVMMDDITNEKLHCTVKGHTHPASLGRKKSVASGSQQQALVWAASPLQSVHISHTAVFIISARLPGQVRTPNANGWLYSLVSHMAESLQSPPRL